MPDLRIGSATGAVQLRPSPPGFGEALGRALGDVNRLQLDAARAATEVASGQSQDMAQALVTMQKADITFQFALQIRNKLLEAYQEVMRMPV
jgi:flagellar hook-basal body complex protein FliE